MSEPEAPRPRPQYGEYASPEEQRARIRKPAYPPAEPAASFSPAAPPVPPAPVAAPAGRRRVVDRVVTFVLLGYGLLTVVSALPALVDAGAYVQRVLGVMGVQATLSDPGTARGYGIAAAIVMIVLWIAAAALSWVSLRRGRITWWIPLLAGILANVAAGVLLTIPLYADAGVRAALLSMYGG